VPLLFLSLDNTLLDRAGAFRAWGRDFLAEIGVSASEVDWLDSVDADGLTSAWDLADAIRARYRLRRRPIDLVDEIREGLLAHLRLDPLVAFALRIAADAGWTPVVVTNGESRVQTDKMLRTGLAHQVAAYVISEDVGVRKPNPRIFAIAADKVGMRLAGAWLIGDSPEVDIGGANALGIPSAWVRRGRTWPDDRFAPTMQCNGVIEAVAAVLATKTG
jgi:putative hydrolase of the HAD superfamily